MFFTNNYYIVSSTFLWTMIVNCEFNISSFTYRLLHYFFQLHHYKEKFCTSKYPILVEVGNDSQCEE